MCLTRRGHHRHFSKVIPRSSSFIILVLAVALFGAAILPAQTQTQSSPTPTPSPQAGDQQKPSTTGGEAGGPLGDIGPIAVPKKKVEEPKKEETPQAPQKIEGMPSFSMRVSAALVTLDVGVVTNQGMFVPGLKKEYFRVLEDNVPQTVTSFNQTQAPITAVMLVEFANNDFWGAFETDSIVASAYFTQTLKKEDWIAMITYDIRPHIVADFTQDKREIMEGTRNLIPGLSMSAETNLFDALYDTLDRLETVEGRKYIILVGTGRDTFSKHTLDQMLKKIHNSKDIAIYSIGTGQALRNWAESRGLSRYLCKTTLVTSRDTCDIEYKQADNQMRSFARMTGGKAYFPLFEASFRDAFADIGQTIRNQYSLAYHPTNGAQDGTFRKIKVELVGPDGTPLKMRDEKGKEVKYQVIARDGYTAKRQVE